MKLTKTCEKCQKKMGKWRAKPRNRFLCRKCYMTIIYPFLYTKSEKGEGNKENEEVRGYNEG